MTRWINLLALLPSTTLTLLIISIAFLRFYNANDFTLLGQVTNPRAWSNRLTVAAFLVAMVNLGVEWNRRNRETDRLAQAADERIEARQRRAEEEQRRAEEAERDARRDRIAVERDLGLLAFLIEPSEENRRTLTQVRAVLMAYRQNL